MGLLKFQRLKVIVLDIEGTVCPISFVKDVLFPYALEVLPSVLATQWDSHSFAPYKDAFPPAYRTSPEVFTNHVKDLVSQDLKIPYLKSLQGYLWLSGYQSGALKCPLFPDVYPAMKRWVENDNLKIIIYSSGSIAAQKLLFQYTDVEEEVSQHCEKGDLRPLIGGYFDTTTAGMKVDRDSYKKIVEEVGGEAGEFLFLSDNAKEVEASKEAGMHAVVVVREGNAPLTVEQEQMNLLAEQFMFGDWMFGRGGWLLRDSTPAMFSGSNEGLVVDR